MKKVLAATLAATMVMSTALTVGATATTVSGGSGKPTYAEAASVSSNVPVKVAGLDVVTTVAGVYAAQTVQGAAITVPTADIKAALNLGTGQSPKVVMYDTDPAKSTAAMACVNAAAEVLGAEVLACLNIDLSAVQGGKRVELADGSVGMAVGLPKGADASKTYSIVCVRPGGATETFEDQDTNPKTVTFPVQAGLGTYAIVCK